MPQIDASNTSQTAGLVIFEDGSAGAVSQVGPFTPQLVGLAVYETKNLSDYAATPLVSGLVVYEESAPPANLIQTATSQILGQVVWGENVREQLDIRAWAFEMDGHEFVAFSFGGLGTYVYDDTTGRWSEWSTQGYDPLWNAENGVYWYEGRYVAGTIQDALVVELDFDSQTDEGFRTIYRTATALITLRHRDQNLEVGALHLDASFGSPSYKEPNPPGPRIGLRYSDDEGKTWTSYEYVTLDVGSVTQDVQWRSLGTIFAPGRIFEISDEGGAVRIDGAKLDTGGE